MSPWVLMDFRSPSRLLPRHPGVLQAQRLISDQGKKKLAFSVLERAYTGDTIGHPQ